MKIIEYRILMPLTIEENLIGQLWSFAEVSRINTGGGEGVEIIENTLFDLPLDNNGKLIIKNLPEYEDHETQKSNTSSASSSASSTSRKSFFSRKSASKENNNQTQKDQLVGVGERSKSLDRPDIESLSSSQQLHHSHTFNGVFDPDSNSIHRVFNYSHDMTKYGQYTHKLYKIASKLPWFIKKLLPKDSTLIHEKSWNMYPTVKTVLTNEYFKSNLRVELDTVTREFRNGTFEYNVHNLTEEQLNKREIVVIDIAEQVAPSEYKQDEDPALFKSTKTNRGPLVPGEWYKTQKPVICCYKLVSAEIKIFGLQTRAENYLKGMYKQLFNNFHRQIFCWIDKWHGLTLEEVRKIEYDLAKLLVKKIEEGELSKTKLASE